MNRTKIESNGRYEYFKIDKFTNLMEGSISKDVANTYMKCDKIPLLWRKFFLNFANNRDCVYKYCKRPFNDFHRHFSE